jgi:hypothetical protein
MKHGFVQFTDESGKVVTTNGSLSFIQDGSRNLAFYGSRGKSELNDDEYKTVIEDIGFDVPVSVPVVPDDDDDTDFVLP